MSFLKSKAYKILNAIDIFLVMIVGIITICIASGCNINIKLSLILSVLVCVFSVYVLVFNVISIILFAKSKKQSKISSEDQNNEEK